MTQPHKNDLHAENEPQERGVKGALERLYASGQTLLIRRIDLLVEEGRVIAKGTLVGLIGSVIALLGWIRVMNGLVEVATRAMPHFWAEILVGALHVALGVGVLWWSRAVARKAARAS